ncbi:MAG: DUF1461 domain-containing protein [Anaeroplasma bactoclasticum]|nr:DUF1461 domain-containing protein [Anaeroplasma bactoclasticum]
MHKLLSCIDRMICILASLLLITLMGCLAVLPIAKSKSYYMKEHEKNHVETILETESFNGKAHIHYDENHESYLHYLPVYDITKQDIETATSHIIDYLYHQDVTSMQFQLDTSEGKIDFFSKQAIDHMADVKVLFIGGIRLCYISILLFVLCIVYIGFFYHRIQPILAKTYLITVASFVVFTFIVATYAILDFDSAFVFFHQIIFPDSEKVNLALSFSYCDTLTNLLTGEFFMHIGLLIGIIFLALLLISLAITLVIQKYGHLWFKKIANKS